jgi:hypothetical protein
LLQDYNRYKSPGASFAEKTTMKQKCVVIALLLLFMCILKATPAQSAAHEKVSGPNLIAKQKENNMKKTLITVLALAMFFAFGLQAALAQDDKLDSGAEDILNQMATFQKILEKGESYDPNSSPAYPWNKRATSAEERQRFYERWEPTAYTRKKFDEALNAIAKLLNDKNRVVKEEMPLAVKFLLDEVDRIQKEVDDFDPAESIFIVNDADGQWLLRAVSMREREKWAKGFFKPGIGGKKEFWQKLDVLAASGAKKIPTFKPNEENFVFHNAAEEGLMKAKLGAAKIHKIGLAHKTWEISKNDLDLPINRYKRGYAWAKDPADDHSHCHLYQVNIIQDYAGGGKYGERYAKFLGDWLVACP